MSSNQPVLRRILLLCFFQVSLFFPSYGYTDDTDALHRVGHDLASCAATQELLGKMSGIESASQVFEEEANGFRIASIYSFIMAGVANPRAVTVSNGSYTNMKKRWGAMIEIIDETNGEDKKAVREKIFLDEFTKEVKRCMEFDEIVTKLVAISRES